MERAPGTIADTARVLGRHPQKALLGWLLREHG